VSEAVRIPDVAGEILGWKALRYFGGTGGVLQSPMQTMTWSKTSWTNARCNGGHHFTAALATAIGGALPPHEIPEKECSCGIYAVADALDAMTYFRGSNYVLARAALSGKVIPGAKGWRAERARIHSIARVGESFVLDMLAREYGVEVVEPPFRPDEGRRLSLPATIRLSGRDGQVYGEHHATAEVDRLRGRAVLDSPARFDAGGYEITIKEWDIGSLTLAEGDKLIFTFTVNHL